MPNHSLPISTFNCVILKNFDDNYKLYILNGFKSFNSLDSNDPNFSKINEEFFIDFNEEKLQKQLIESIKRQFSGLNIDNLSVYGKKDIF